MLGAVSPARQLLHHSFTGRPGRVGRLTPSRPDRVAFTYAISSMHRYGVQMSRAGRARSFPAATILTLAVLAASPSSSRAAPALSFQPELGFPASDVSMVGVSPGEAPGAVWAIGSVGPVPASVNGQPFAGEALLHHAQGEGWQVVPVADAQGTPLEFARGGVLGDAGSPLVSDDGGIVLPTESGQSIITREPGGTFVQAPAPGEPALKEHEALFPGSTSELAPDYVALDEGGHTGALVIPEPVSSLRVLHYDGVGWTAEPICSEYNAKNVCTEAEASIQPLAIAASSPQNAWLLAKNESGEPLLFQRTFPAGAAQPVWVQTGEPSSWVPSGDAISARSSGQMLTVTSQGVWVDATLVEGKQLADISVLLDVASPSTLLGTWCYPRVGSQAKCTAGAASLGAPLPEGYKSFAWPGAGTGTRIITGLEEGALLRLQESGDFEYVVGGGGNPSGDAAFVSPEEGWIAGAGGSDSAKVEHVTATPTASSLQSWPLPFRRPLTAIATQPGATPGSADAQALAVGDRGQIARFIPGEGWTPEFLYSASGTVAEPRLRGVAWPEPDRAYAVGDGGAMWLWRAETGLWEPDPAAPVNFHANLTAIAFSAENPALGDAVGKQGTLLAYDKTWTQQALPAGLEQADFTSVAFAGGEALVTYRLVNAADEEEGRLDRQRRLGLDDRLERSKSACRASKFEGTRSLEGRRPARWRCGGRRAGVGDRARLRRRSVALRTPAAARSAERRGARRRPRRSGSAGAGLDRSRRTQRPKRRREDLPGNRHRARVGLRRAADGDRPRPAANQWLSAA